METSQEKYRKIKEFGLKQDLPEIPDCLYLELEQAYNQYLQLAGIYVGDFDEVKIQQHREKYKHFYSGLKQGSPIFDNDNCLEYMNLISGISKKYCAIYMYLYYLESVASGGVVAGEETWEEILDSQLWFTKKVIKEESENHQKRLKEIFESQLIQSQESSKSHQSILGTTGSGKSITFAALLSQDKEIKIRFKKTDD